MANNRLFISILCAVTFLLHVLQSYLSPATRCLFDRCFSLLFFFFWKVMTKIVSVHFYFLIMWWRIFCFFLPKGWRYIRRCIQASCFDSCQKIISQQIDNKWNTIKHTALPTWNALEMELITAFWGFFFVCLFLMEHCVTWESWSALSLWNC